MFTSRPDSSQPIPKNAKRVFKGVLFDTYQWEQKMYDGSSKIFEKVKRADTVNIIPITYDGKILLAKQEQPGTIPFISGLGGIVDKDESPLACAKRELLEEAGMKADTFVLWYAKQILDKIDWAIYTFIAKGIRTVGKQKLDTGEKIELFTVTFDEYLSIVKQDNFRDSEIALKLLRIQTNAKEIERVRKLFFSL